MCDGFLTGVVSWGENCSLPNVSGDDKSDLPLTTGVYADVAFYNDWINKTLTTRNETEPTVVNFIFIFLACLFVFIICVLVLRFCFTWRLCKRGVVQKKT